MKRLGLSAFSLIAAIATPVWAQAPALDATTSKAETTAPLEQKAMSIQVTAPDAKAVATPAGDDKKADDVAAAPAAPTPPPAPVITLVAKVDLSTQKVTVHEHGKARFTWSISSGAQGYNTPRGNFQPAWMAKMWYSKQYDNAPMPHAVFFSGGAAMHATQAVGSLGRPASHGCVRLAPGNAATFYALVQRHGMKHTRIHVFGAPNHGPNLVARRSVPQQPRLAYAPRPVGYAQYAGANYVGSGSAFASQTTYRPMPPIRVVQYGRRY